MAWTKEQEQKLIAIPSWVLLLLDFIDPREIECVHVLFLTPALCSHFRTSRNTVDHMCLVFIHYELLQKHLSIFVTTKTENNLSQTDK